MKVEPDCAVSPSARYFGIFPSVGLAVDSGLSSKVPFADGCYVTASQCHLPVRWHWLWTLKLAGQLKCLLRWNLGATALTVACRYSWGQRQHMIEYLLPLLQAWTSWTETCKCSKQKVGTTWRAETYPLGLYTQGCDGSCRTWRLGGFPESVVQLLHKMHKSLHEVLWSVVSNNQTRWSRYSSFPLAFKTVTTLTIKASNFPLFHSAVNAWKEERGWIWFGSRGQVRNKIIKSIKVKMKSSQITEF